MEIKITAYEWFCMVKRDKITMFEYVRTMSSDPRSAINELVAKDFGKRITEVQVYNSADDYHRRVGSLCFTQYPHGYPK